MKEVSEMVQSICTTIAVCYICYLIGNCALEEDKIRHEYEKQKVECLQK